MKHIEEGLVKANDIMQTMANSQVMLMAPPEILGHYFSDIFDLINKQSRNKKELFSWKMQRFQYI